MRSGAGRHLWDVEASRQGCAARQVCHHYFLLSTQAAIKTMNITNLSAEPSRRPVNIISTSEWFTVSIFTIKMWAWCRQLQHTRCVTLCSGIILWLIDCPSYTQPEDPLSCSQKTAVTCSRADSHCTSRFRSVIVPSPFRQIDLCSHCRVQSPSGIARDWRPALISINYAASFVFYKTISSNSIDVKWRREKCCSEW